MATREENLKKINAQLEQLSDEQLENVVGGSWGESADDFKEASNRGIGGFTPIKDYNDPAVIGYLLKNWTEGDNVVGKLKAMFASYGIDMQYNGKPFGNNIYKYNGKKISQDEAWKIIDGK